MDGLQAIILVCLGTVFPDQHAEQPAIAGVSKHVDTGLGCSSGWQHVIARSAQGDNVGPDPYARTLCCRSR
jgi:hypothetical protein